MPYFSIITSVLNRDKSIARCIESVANQKNVILEHIIIDGNSKDGTIEIVEEYKKKYKHIVFKSENDTGIYNAWNKAIELATGSWYLFLGSDDYLVKDNVLEKVKQNIQLSSEQLSFISCLLFKGNSKNVVGDKSFADNPFDGPSFKMPPHGALFHSSAIFVNGYRFDESYKAAADKKLYFQLFGQANIQYINIIVTFFSLGGITNSSGKKLKLWLEKNRIRKEFNHPIVPKPYFRSLLSVCFGDILHFKKRFSITKSK